MKKSKMKRLLQGLKNIRSNYYSEFTEKEHLILSKAISHFEKESSKSKWLKTGRKILESLAAVIKNLF